jgi:hypothetical protein
MNVSDVMTKVLVTVRSDAYLQEAAGSGGSRAIRIGRTTYFPADRHGSTG